MKPQINTADASYYFHEDATADAARMDTTAVCGNIADAMRDAVIVVENTQIIEMISEGAALLLPANSPKFEEE